MISFSDKIVKSGLLKKEPYILLLGFVADSVLADVVKAFSKSDSCSKSLFANYSEIDIAKGTHFQKVFDLHTTTVEDVKCELDEVTQQFGKPFDYIPAGWKTICKINFFNEVPSLIESLPTIEDWSDKNSKAIILTNDSFWKEYCRIISDNPQ
jgi:hypothetical protein